MSRQSKLIFLFFFILFFCLGTNGFSTDINVRIYSSDSLKSVLIAPETGNYLIEGDGKIIDTCLLSSVYKITINDTLLEIRSLNKPLGKYTDVRFIGYGENNSFKIKPVGSAPSRIYDDNIEISKANFEEDSTITCLKIVNSVSLENYISGVVECEAGSGHNSSLEFYKVQAIICRTYALNNINRHLHEMFELCDREHCQVYKGITKVPLILKAVEDTRSIVLVDSKGKLINAAFCSNCGGYTLNSEDVWSKSLPYLRSVRDTFCFKQPHAVWEKQISLGDWNRYLKKAERISMIDTIHPKEFYDSIPAYKKLYFYDNGYLIPLKLMRFELSLRSTYFTVNKSENTVIIDGRGNGHRVGLCQEGALHMAQLGYNYRQILNFYYKGVQLIDSSSFQNMGTN